ncbi:MAG: alpha/beta hydrolase [Mesorhizobium sp.]|nr:alpha/beta hydrolase [Mesorhizobium sp.]MCO5163686.1 alpha/beta hydrolase [Mesorhizobium sp.]
MKVTADDGVELDAWVEGDGPAIVFLHEFGGDQRSWREQVDAFRDRYRCIVPAARGYPPSDAPGDPQLYSQDRMNKDVIAVLDSLKIDKAHLVGLSMGAYTALRVGMLYPHRIRSVVFSAGGSGADAATRDDYLRETRRVADLMDETGQVPARDFGISSSRIQLKHKRPAMWEEFVRNMGEHPARSAALVLRGIQASRPSLYDYAKDFETFDLPLFCLVGDEDEACLNVNLWLKRLIPSARLMTFPNSGHAINLEEPDLYNSSIAAFLKEVDGGTWHPRLPEARAGGTYLGTVK